VIGACLHWLLHCWLHGGCSWQWLLLTAVGIGEIWYTQTRLWSKIRAYVLY
jgi:hypothetical protein